MLVATRGMLCKGGKGVLFTFAVQKATPPRKRVRSTAVEWPRTGLRLATAAMPALAAMRPAHEHARAEHTRHARCTRASLASDAHALTLQHSMQHVKSVMWFLVSLATG